jgi:hypothetical protein
MIQYPTNLQPQIITRRNNVQFSFTFNGDVLSWVWLYIYDNDTGEIIYTTCKGDGTPMAYNGETVTIEVDDLSEILQYGKTYVYKYILCQAISDETTITPKADLYIGRGGCLGEEGKATTGALFVAGNLKNVYEFEKTSMGWYEPKVKDGQQTTVVEIEIFGKRITATEYYSFNDMNVGILNTNVPADEQEPVAVGTPFRLYSNYLFTPSYFFEVSSQPEIELNLFNIGEGIKCVGDYSHPEGVAIKYYTLTLKQDKGGKIIEVAKSPKMYSQKIDYNFITCDKKEYNYITLDIVLQNGQTATTLRTFQYTHRRNFIVEQVKATSNAKDKCIDLVWNYVQEVEDGKQYETYIYRTNLNTGLTEYLDSFMNYELINDERVINLSYKDYKVASGVEYKYTFVSVDYTGSYETVEDYGSIASNSAKINFNHWIISSLEYVGKKINQIASYHSNQTWELIAELDDVTITQNLNRTLHVSSGVLPSVSASNTNFATGSLQAMLGTMNCKTKEWVDDINVVEEWRKFITAHNQFLLQSPKGDMWIVSITDNPTTEYEMGSRIVTYVNFDWTETEKANNVIIWFGGDR